MSTAVAETKSRKGIGGPKTSEGKERVRLNALKMGLHANSLAGMQALADVIGVTFESVLDEMREHHQPTDAMEEALVRRMARSLWKLRLVEAIEDNLIRTTQVRNAPGVSMEALSVIERRSDVQFHRAIQALALKRKTERENVKNKLAQSPTPNPQHPNSGIIASEVQPLRGQPQVPTIKAIIFDMDGVLVDSEPFICEAATRMFAEHNLTVSPDDFIPFVGAGENRYIGGVAEKYGFPLDMERDKARTYAIYGEIAKGRLEPLAGAREFIAKARERGLKLAIASSADRIKVETNLREIGVPADMFDAVVSGLDVVRKKPDPEIFLHAAGKIGVEPSACLVVEDAVNGIAAAKAAGMRCLGLTTSFSPADLADADWTAPDLAHAPEGATEW